MFPVRVSSVPDVVRSQTGQGVPRFVGGILGVARVVLVPNKRRAEKRKPERPERLAQVLADKSAHRGDGFPRAEPTEQLRAVGHAHANHDGLVFFVFRGFVVVTRIFKVRVLPSLRGKERALFPLRLRL